MEKLGGKSSDPHLLAYWITSAVFRVAAFEKVIVHERKSPAIALGNPCPCSTASGPPENDKVAESLSNESEAPFFIIVHPASRRLSSVSELLIHTLVNPLSFLKV